MGKVYLAKQSDLHRQVVIKVMHEHVANDPKFRERFQRETLLMANFQHPYAVTLHDAVLNSPDGPIIVMEYVRGETLDQILARNKRLSAARVGRILGQLCEVLQAAHNQGIVHRDLKPSNLMVLDSDSPYEKIKVMDFGLAKLVDRRPMQGSESSNEFAIGTPAYMCPEQIQGDEMDHRGDLYSVGVMMYELLTGHLPFIKTSTMEMFLAHTLDPPPRMVGDDVWVPPAVESVVLMCLSKKPGDRPASARELAQLYEEALAGDVRAMSEAPPEAALDTGDLPPPLPISADPSEVVYQLNAWMPESVAAYKLRGFIQDVGGEVIENQPGLVRVRLGGKGSQYQMPRGGLSWLGIGGKHSIEMELRLDRSNAAASNLRVTVLLRYLGKSIDPEWRVRCNQIYCDLRGYLLGQDGGHASLAQP